MLDIQNKPNTPYIIITSIDSKEGLSDEDYQYIVDSIGVPLRVYAMYYTTDGRIGHMELYRPDSYDVLLIDSRVKCTMQFVDNLN